MKLIYIPLCVIMMTATPSMAVTPPPAPEPVQYDNSTSNDTESYITDNQVSQSMYDALIGFAYSTYTDALDTFELFFTKLIATVGGYSGYSVVRDDTQNPSGSTRGLVTLYDESGSAKPVVFITTSSPGGAGPWKVNENPAGNFELQAEQPPQEVPIDAGSSLLLAAGAAYGVARLRKKNHDNEELRS